MNLSDLLKTERIKKRTSDAAQARECLKSAERSLALAKDVRAKDVDWTLTIAYDALLQSARAIMFADGYAPTGTDHHSATLDYAAVKFGSKFKDEVATFETLRRKRNRNIYEKSGATTDYEAGYAISVAEKILAHVKEISKKWF